MSVLVKNVVMKYGKNEAVHGVNMEIETGTIHGLIGENGSGKTTLIKCIMGIFKPSSGEVLVDGEGIYENPRVKARIGYVADNNKYFPTYRLGKVAEFFQEVYEKFDMNKLKELNQIFQLDMNKRVNELSKGQQMRLAFMLNIAANTEILVMDEPTSGIDAIAKKNLFNILIKEVEERNLTVLISSHNLIELEKICDSVTILKNGNVIEQDGMDSVIGNVRKFNYAFKDGAPEEFLKHPKLLTFNNIGNIYTVVFEGITDEEIEEIENLKPQFCEELNVNLEDVFVYSNGGGAGEK